MLELTWNLKVSEDHRPHEHVVDAQALFNEIAADVFDACLMSIGLATEHPPHHKHERNTKADPHD